MFRRKALKDATANTNQRSAFFNGRDEVAPLDLLLFKDCLWHDEASRTALLEMIGEFSRLYGYQQLALTRELLSLREQFKQLQGAVALRIGCKAVKRKQWFGRRARGTELPLANARPFGKLVHFQLLTPAPLDGSDPERLTGTLTFDRTLLSHWHPTGRRWWVGPSATPRRGTTSWCWTSSCGCTCWISSASPCP